MTLISRGFDKSSRIGDVLLAGAALILVAPLMGFIAITVQLALGGPVVVRQLRIGRHGRIFAQYKFRTVRQNSQARRLVTDSECRSQVGARIRSMNLDKLPSLWNVLRGDMTFIGPRPVAAACADLIPVEQLKRYAVRPGLAEFARVTYTPGPGY